MGALPVNICGLSVPAADDLPDAGSGMCCIGAAIYGPDRCTCWEPVYDLDQTDPVPVPASTRAEPCDDCAFRPDSPERQGDERYVGDEYELNRLVREGQPFSCHKGIRRPLRWEHRPADCKPSDCDELNPGRVTVVPGDPANYSPPIIDGQPYKADGTPADICAGWAARRRALA